MLFRAGRTKRLVLLSAWVARWSLASSVPVSRCGARRWGCRSFLRRGVRHEAVRRETVGRDQSEGATSPGSGVMTCAIRADREVCAHPRAVGGAGPGFGDLIYTEATGKTKSGTGTSCAAPARKGCAIYRTPCRTRRRVCRRALRHPPTTRQLPVRTARTTRRGRGRRPNRHARTTRVRLLADSRNWTNESRD